MKQQKAHFSGMDQDSSDEKLKDSHYRYALNCSNGNKAGRKKGRIQNLEGNEEITFDQPPGQNQCIGTYRDRVDESIIYFVYNSLKHHQILRFFPSTSQIIQLIQSALLDFSLEHPITGIALDDQLLYWTDGHAPQKKLNINKALTNKKLKLHLYVEEFPAVGEVYHLLVSSEQGTIYQNQPVFTVTLAGLRQYELTKNITDGINNLNQNPPLFKAEDKGSYIELSFLTPGYFVVRFFGVKSYVMTCYENMYERPLRASYLDMIKAPPLFPPVSRIVKARAEEQQNHTKERLFQFRTRYLYDDHERSVLSPVSLLPTGYLTYADTDEKIIELDYGTERIRQSAELCVIHGIELFFREENSGKWKKIKTLLREEFIGAGYKYRFLNNGAYSAISKIDSDKLFDSIPLKSETLEIMNNFFFLDAKEEAYDNIPVDIVLQLVVNPAVPFNALSDRGLFLKRPGRYQWGLIYFDRANRSSSVQANQRTELFIPHYADNLQDFPYIDGPGGKRQGTVSLKWQIRHRPPVWATHYCWARTEESLHNHYFQSKVSNVNYYEKNQTTVSSYTGAHTFIELSFRQWNALNDEHTDAKYGWTFKEGDKVRFLTDHTNSWLADTYESEIVSQSGNIFLIKSKGIGVEIKKNFWVEFYTPGKKAEHEVFYEVGAFYKIGNPHTAQRYHKGETSDQDAAQPLLVPAKGVLTRGDNFRVVSLEDDFIVDSPRASLTSKATMNSYNKGRANLITHQAGSSQRGHTIRVSNKRFHGTKLNGYSTFNSIDSYDLQKSYGPIQKLAQLDNILLCLCRKEALSLYIEEKIYTDLSGKQVLTISDKVIGDDRVLKGKAGTEHPESFTRYGSRGYWFCREKGMYMRYAADGLTPISNYYMSSYFHRKANELTLGEGQVRSCYDPFEEKLVVSFSKIIQGKKTLFPAETITFDEDEKRWISFVSFFPEEMQSLSGRFFTFSKGQLYKHHVPGKTNTFFGKKEGSVLELVFNEAPDNNKVYTTTAQQGNAVWGKIQLTTPEGQVSSLLESDFEKLEETWYSPILMDENTPNVANPITEGDALLSRTLHMRLENNANTPVYLFAVYLGSIPSFLNPL